MGLGIWDFSGSLITNMRTQNSEIQNGEPKCKNLVDSDETKYFEIFWDADYERELKIHKFKMADSISRTKMQKVGRFGWN